MEQLPHTTEPHFRQWCWEGRGGREGKEGEGRGGKGRGEGREGRGGEGREGRGEEGKEGREGRETTVPDYHVSSTCSIALAGFHHKKSREGVNEHRTPFTNTRWSCRFSLGPSLPSLLC